MRAIFRVGFIALVVAAWGCGEEGRTASASPPVNSSFSVLDAYGQWIDFPGYGQVWQPRVSYDWQPFVEGRWVWTDRGWLWDSNEPFGWVVYHYGYWVQEGAAGWLWVPGYDWSPARVRWVVRDDLIGWAPVEPPGEHLPVAAEPQSWVVVSPRHFMSRNVGRQRLSPAESNIATREGIQPQPDVNAIERLGGKTIDRVQLQTERVGVGDRQLIRVRIPEKGLGTNGVSSENGATVVHSPALPPAASSRRSIEVMAPAKPTPVKSSRKSVATSKSQPRAERSQAKKEKTVDKEKKERRANDGPRDKPDRHERRDAFKK